jgi:hypothetical protein
MKNRKMTLMALATAFVLASCGDSKKENAMEEGSAPMQNEMHMSGNEDHDMDGHDMDNMDHKMEKMSGNLDDGQKMDVEFKNEALGQVYQHYLNIKTALVNSKSEEAQTAAKELTKALSNVEGNGKALSAAKEIAQTDNLDSQRNNFQDLSAGVEILLDGAVASGEIYKQFCPMAFDGKGGYWLSASKEVRNPYYGDKMLKCGSVRATIK